MKKKVMIVATGGTIAMKYDEASQGLIPACTGEDLAAAVPGLSELADLEFFQFSNVASCAMTPEIMFRLKAKLDEILSRDDITGVVITHGTDTTEETSFMLDMLYQGEKPIVVTAAMRGAGDTSPDGPANIYCSVKTAASDEVRGMGVLVCLNDTLHAPVDVMKTHSANCATFDSPWWGPVGYVEPDKVLIRRRVLGKKHFAPKALTARVDLIKAVTGAGRDLVDFVVAQGAKGIVVEGFGRGNIPPGMVPGIEDAVKKGVAVVIASRTLAGRVLDVYGYPGSVTATRKVGAVMGAELTAAKARLVLMLALSENPNLANDQKALQACFE